MKIEYIYAGMLIHKTGNKIEEANLKKVLEAAGVAVDESLIKATVAALDGVDIEDAIAKAAVAAPAAAAPASGDAPAAEAKKEKKEDDAKSTEDAAAGLGALFG